MCCVLSAFIRVHPRLFAFFPHVFPGRLCGISLAFRPLPVSIAVNYIDSSALARLKFAHGTVTFRQHTRPISQMGKVELAAGKDVTWVMAQDAAGTAGARGGPQIDFPIPRGAVPD